MSVSCKIWDIRYSSLGLGLVSLACIYIINYAFVSNYSVILVIIVGYLWLSTSLALKDKSSIMLRL